MLSSSPPPPFTAFVNFPSRFFTSLITAALLRTYPSLSILSSLPAPPPLPLLQWADYDLLNHELTLSQAHSDLSRVLSCSYVIRKSLIRKHYLASTVAQWLAKHPSSLLGAAVPKTWAVEVRFADELEELWADELWDLGKYLDEQEEAEEEEERRWYILKPGMADKGQGIRMFSSKHELEEIFEEFEEESKDDDDDDEDATALVDGENGKQDGGRNGESTRVNAQQMRHFVIQEYVPRALLLNPLAPHTHSLTPHKFHLRAYVVSSRSSPLTLYLHPRLLALFSALPYVSPRAPMTQESLMGHLTNTCLQKEETKERFVFELAELVGWEYALPLPATNTHRTGSASGVITEEDLGAITRGVGEVLAETWRAALGAGQVHFQPLPNAFELFGCDLLVSLRPPVAVPCSGASQHNEGKFLIHLLEINACPDVEQTGTRLNGVIEDLVGGIVQDIVVPWAREIGGPEPGEVGHTLQPGAGLVKILELGVRGA
ncbi:hypothetical protein DACRYDRAFT_107694 [Dacryopinax primogenitus]|uniref:TTL-domain-containing protein n=1 Tax=Dacryopinax primogenitus (strain DJM 731) TaxID=1858805 RepID=M5GCU0_DACPD|nr:uncharacterized protein DACRYDRAFT_107694 [Dacryopinax primogenitus]EJU01968.1 hypothetical protein DACRYDRAFT_107694 [Dacryopinax primogenitus]